MQAIGAIVHSHEIAGVIFAQLEQSPDLLAAGLGMGNNYAVTPQILRQRALFLLRANTSINNLLKKRHNCSCNNAAMIPLYQVHNRSHYLKKYIYLHGESLHF